MALQFTFKIRQFNWGNWLKKS